MLTKFVIRYIIFLISVLSVSCASNPINIATLEAVPDNLIPVVDNRPVSDRQTKLPKLKEVSYYPGDDKFQPNIVESLQIALTKKLDSTVPQTEISIEHSQVLNFFGEHDNEKNRSVTKSFFTGLLVDAWLESQKFENSNFVSCKVLGNVNGKKFTAVYAEPYEVKSMAYLVVYKGSDANKATENVVKKCVEIAAEEIITKINGS